ncbi:hypothetical protein CTEN210_12369 [Chaetoceros tenuissimus]|uniref:TerD domain-containing protein n=1 Tax=Chaetoceros tenuissimus TaxID=426638 RepID=A0AAD3HAF2_9STRA|nr:hypothetical protein CTEN210_12369 [Chaetoceros tenuissimus]
MTEQGKKIINQDQGWIKVKSKGMSKMTPYSSSIPRPSSTTSGSTNRFDIPKILEKKLHHNSAITSLIGVKGPGSRKCQKRNQRRNRKRAERRAMREMEKKCGMVSNRQDDESQVQAVSTKQIFDEIWTSSILSFLEPKDVLTFGICGKHTQELSDTAHVWSLLMKREFPHSDLTPSCPREYKLAFKLTRLNLLQNFRCFHTRKTFFEGIIGVGVDYTINPKTRIVDYISLSQDLVSKSSFDIGNTSDVFDNTYKLFLPLYFSNGHFQRALPLIKKAVRTLYHGSPSGEFKPSMILNVFPKVVNTFVVLLSDSGIAASRKSYIGLLRIHRLFLALAEEFPEIRINALSKLQDFTKHEWNRRKETCPSLGNLLPLLFVVDEKDFSWGNLWKVYLNEVFDRSVLWICKEYPELKDVSSVPDDERLQKSFTASKVSLRLTMINVYFQWLLCKGSIQDRALMYDTYYSSPYKDTASQLNEHLSYQKFRYQIHSIMQVKNWQGFYKYALAPCPHTKHEMVSILHTSVKNSLRKNYHKTSTDFTAIHKSGTSKILSKGEKYSAAKGMEILHFEDRWTFDHPNDIIYLDASCLVYKGKKRVATIDYSHLYYKDNAVIHSGDRINEKTGLHTIELDLTKFSPDVTSLFFVLSAWDKATLFDIKDASIRFYDPQSNGTLCLYNLDAHDKVADLTSIIICKLYRISGEDQWHVTAIGDTHKGAASNYGPIYKAVEKLL